MDTKPTQDDFYNTPNIDEVRVENRPLSLNSKLLPWRCTKHHYIGDRANPVSIYIDKYIDIDMYMYTY